MDWLTDLLWRQWTDLLARPSGPFAFRFYLQPTMAIIAALKDGLTDARTGRTPYFWTILTNPQERRAALREGFRATLRILVLGMVMDTAYQVVALHTFYPAEAIIISLLLAFVPYLLTRGPIARVARWWMERTPTSPAR
jgi:hypothetical protein